MRVSRAISVVAVLALALTACSPGEELAEQMLESEEGVGDVEIDVDDGRVEIEGEDEEGGSFSIGGGDIPDGFPVDFPSGGEVQSVVEQGEQAMVSVRYEDDFDSLKSFYEDWVGSHGEVVGQVESSNPQSIVWTVEEGDQTYSIAVADAGILVQVTITVVSTN